MDTGTDFSLFSKYRSVLMGIAIFEVMLGHTIDWAGIAFSNPVIDFVFSRFSCMVHTPGFLLLSGLGLYYSFVNNSNLKQFYIRRIQRMWLPFMMMAIPLYAYSYYQKGTFDILEYIGLATSLGYWFGDTNMWYIALSIVLYAFFPFCYKWMQRSWQKRTILISISSVIGCLMVYYTLPTYFSKVYLALPKIPIFFLGIYIGHLSVERRSCSAYKYIGLFLCLAVFSFILSRVNSFYMYYCDLALFPITIWFVCLVYHKLQEFYLIKLLLAIWNWLGKYTLELYVLHILLARLLSPGNDIQKILLVMIIPLLICTPVQKVTQKLSNLLITI